MSPISSKHVYTSDDQSGNESTSSSVYYKRLHVKKGRKTNVKPIQSTMQCSIPYMFTSPHAICASHTLSDMRAAADRCCVCGDSVTMSQHQLTSAAVQNGIKSKPIGRKEKRKTNPDGKPKKASRSNKRKSPSPKRGYFMPRDVAKTLFNLSALMTPELFADGHKTVKSISDEKFMELYSEANDSTAFPSTLECSQEHSASFVNVCWFEKFDDTVEDILFFNSNEKQFWCRTASYKNALMKLMSAYHKRFQFNLADFVPELRDVHLNSKQRESMDYVLSGNASILSLSLFNGLVTEFSVNIYLKHSKYVVCKELKNHEPGRCQCILAMCLINEILQTSCEEVGGDLPSGALQVRFSKEEKIAKQFVVNTLRVIKSIDPDQFKQAVKDGVVACKGSDITIEHPYVFTMESFKQHPTIIDRFTTKYKNILDMNNLTINDILYTLVFITTTSNVTKQSRKKKPSPLDSLALKSPTEAGAVRLPGSSTNRKRRSATPGRTIKQREEIYSNSEDEDEPQTEDQQTSADEEEIPTYTQTKRIKTNRDNNFVEPKTPKITLKKKTPRGILKSQHSNAFVDSAAKVAGGGRRTVAGKKLYAQQSETEDEGDTSCLDSEQDDLSDDEDVVRTELHLEEGSNGMSD